MGEIVLDEVVPDSVFGVRSSLTISKLAEALSKAQGEMEAAAKDSTNPHFKSAYADLASVWAAVRGPLSRNGLAVCQFPSSEGAIAKVVTMLTHSSGEWTASELKIKSQSDSAQNIGSAITYARRYSLMAVCGIAPDDDDGNAASGREGEQKQQQKKPQRQTESRMSKEAGDHFTGEQAEPQPLGKQVAYVLHHQYGCKNADDYSILVGHCFNDPSMKWDQVKADDEHMKHVIALLKDACGARGVAADKLLEDIKAELAESKELQSSL